MQDRVEPGLPEVIEIAEPQRGEYVVGALFYSDGADGNGVDPNVEVTVACAGEVHRFGPERLMTPQLNGQRPDLWQVARVTWPGCDVVELDAVDQLVCDQLQAACRCEGCALGVCVEAGCPDARCDPVEGVCGPEPCDGVECPDGERCDPGTGECVEVEQGCQRNTDCAEEEYCDRLTRACAPTGSGQTGSGGACQVDDDCAPGLVCPSLFMTCSAVCDTDQDCPDGFPCGVDFLRQGLQVCTALPIPPGG